METHLCIPSHHFTELNQLPISLQLGNFSCDILSWGYFSPNWWRNYLHRHSFFEVCYVFQGKGLFRIAQTDYIVQKGDLFVAWPGEIHEIISSAEDPLGIYFWSYTLIPHCEHSTKPAGTQTIDTLLNAFLSSRCFVSARTPAVLRTLELLTEEIAQRAPGYLQVIEGLVTKLILDVARAVVDIPALPNQAELPCAHNSDEAVVQVIIRYLHDNYSRPISVRDLAVQVHLSERHTSRLFHKAQGISIMAYLTALRMDIAAQLLLNQQLPIKTVAQECGYPNVRYFITLFRRSMRLTPAVFRQKGGTHFLSK